MTEDWLLCWWCNGPLEEQGQLGLLQYARCRNCGMYSCKQDPTQLKKRKR
jgi:hypothetical protein